MNMRIVDVEPETVSLILAILGQKSGDPMKAHREVVRELKKTLRALGRDI